MASAIDATDLDWLILFDYEKEVPCETRHGDCDKPVEWKLTKKCCDFVRLLCDFHKRNDEEWHKKHINDFVQCFTCGDIHKSGNVNYVRI